MHKIAQKVTSVALAASMLLSMFAVNTVAFADEFKDNTTAVSYTHLTLPTNSLV